MLDGDLTKMGVAHMQKMGMEFHLECPVQSIESAPSGAKVVCKNKAGETVSFEAEKLSLIHIFPGTQRGLRPGWQSSATSPV